MLRNRFGSVMPFLPLVSTAALVVWTLYVSPYSKYGDNWAIVPALLALSVVIALHIDLLVKNGWRLNWSLYAVVHGFVFLMIWIWCLTLISKDSL